MRADRELAYGAATGLLGDLLPGDPRLGHPLALFGGEPFPDGCPAGRTRGTHRHGSPGPDGFRRVFPREVAAGAGRRSATPAADASFAGTSFAALREEQLDRLGDPTEQHADTDALRRLTEPGAARTAALMPPGVPA